MRYAKGSEEFKHSHLLNLAGVMLTNIEKDVLCRGLKFGVPPSFRMDKEIAQAEFARYQL